MSQQFEYIAIFAPSNTPTEVLQRGILLCKFKYKAILVPDTVRLPFSEIVKIATEEKIAYATLDANHTGKLQIDLHERMVIQAEAAIVFQNHLTVNKKMEDILQLIRKYKLPYYRIRYNSENGTMQGKQFNWKNK